MRTIIWLSRFTNIEHACEGPSSSVCETRSSLLSRVNGECLCIYFKIIHKIIRWVRLVTSEISFYNRNYEQL